MRTDAQIDHKQVRVPNVQLIGYNKPFAERGDIVVWREDGRCSLGRVIGRIHYAPPLPDRGKDGTPEIVDWLFIAVLSSSASFLMIRWVPPTEIEECFSAKDYAPLIRATIERLLSDDFTLMEPGALAAAIEA